MVAQLPYNLIALPTIHRACKKVQCEVNYVVVVKLLVPKLFTALKPDLVQEVDFFRCKTRRVRTQVKHFFVAGGSEHLQGDSGAWVGDSLPGCSDLARLRGN